MTPASTAINSFDRNRVLELENDEDVNSAIRKTIGGMATEEHVRDERRLSAKTGRLQLVAHVFVIELSAQVEPLHNGLHIALASGEVCPDCRPT